METKDYIELESIRIEDNGVILDKDFIQLIKKLGINNLKEFFQSYSDKIEPYARDISRCMTVQMYTGMYENLRYKYLNGKLDDTLLHRTNYIIEGNHRIITNQGFYNRFRLLGFHWFEIEYMARFFLNKETSFAEQIFNIKLDLFEGTSEQKKEFQTKLDLYKKYIKETLEKDENTNEKSIQKKLLMIKNNNI